MSSCTKLGMCIGLLLQQSMSFHAYKIICNMTPKLPKCGVIFKCYIMVDGRTPSCNRRQSGRDTFLLAQCRYIRAWGPHSSMLVTFEKLYMSA
jgi:hypothetical protein